MPVCVHVHQLTAVVDVIIGGRAVCTLGTQAVSAVGEVPCGFAVGHGIQLSAMLPGIRPGAVCQRVADFIIGYGVAIVDRQQVTPVAVVIGIGDGIGGFSQFAGGIAVFLAV